LKPRRLQKLKTTARWVRAGVRRRALILLYHRVALLDSDIHKLSVTPAHFAEQLEVLRKYTRPIGLRQLAQAVRESRVPRRAVIITFDDGYADNLYNAKPLLERFDIPATVFVTSGYLGQQREFWWDELERVLLQSGTLPEALRLNVNGDVHEWSLNGAAHASEESDAERHLGQEVKEKSNLNQRLFLYRSVHQLLRPMPDEMRRWLLDELVTWAGGGLAAVDPEHLPMSPAEVIRLADGNMIEVGAHTVTHPVLSKIPVDVQQSEITKGKIHLEDILGRSVVSFAYPFGTRSDYTEQTTAIVRQAGFTSACSVFPGQVSKANSLFELPRFAVPDWDGATFERHLNWWFTD